MNGPGLVPGPPYDLVATLTGGLMPVDPSRLRTLSLFDGIHDDDVTMIAQHMEQRLVRPGEHVTRRPDEHPLLRREREVHARQVARGSPRPRRAMMFFCTSSVPAAIVVGTLRTHWRCTRPASGASGASFVSSPPRPRISSPT